MVSKQYSRDLFVFLLFLLTFVAFLFSIKKTHDKPLNRDQTEEWKGWMQVGVVDDDDDDEFLFSV